MIAFFRQKGWRDYDELIKSTRLKITGQLPLILGDVFTDQDKFIWIEKHENGLVHFIAGVPEKPEEMDLFDLPLEEFADLILDESGHVLMEFWQGFPSFVLKTKSEILNRPNEKSKSN